MDETIITWNMTNWTTVVVMVIVFFLVLGLIAQVYRKATAAKVEAQ